jgi:hypothetical protein
MARPRTLAASIMAALLLSMLGVAPATATEQGNAAACTPGYWKNHTDNWLESPGVLIPTTKTVASSFPQAAAYGLGGDSFLTALSYKGGPGAQGAAQTLVHHAVAAWLNAAHDDAAGNLQYPLRRNNSTSFYPGFAGIVPEVNAALASGDRATMLALKDFLDGIANSLPCPLN